MQILRRMRQMFENVFIGFFGAIKLIACNDYF